MKPNLDTGLTTTLNWSEDFSGDLSAWNQDDLVKSAEHRTGNKYLQPDGRIDLDQPWHKLPGRWAALYTMDTRQYCQYIEDGHLIMKGHAVETENPYRDNWSDSSGVVHEYGDYMLYTAWLSSKATITRGSVLEVTVDASAMCMRGHRWSVWLMPTDGRAYTSSTYHAEIDCPELENPSRVKSSDFGNKALMKIVGGAAGDTFGGVVDLLALGIDMREGCHTFTTVWNHDGTLEFYCDGVFVNGDDRAVGMNGRILITREMNSGVKGPTGHAWENLSTGPKMPPDPGLTALSVIQDIDLIDDDVVIVHEVSVYDIVNDGEVLPLPEPPPEPEPEQKSNVIYTLNDGREYTRADAQLAIDVLTELVQQ